MANLLDGAFFLRNVHCLQSKLLEAEPKVFFCRRVQIAGSQNFFGIARLIPLEQKDISLEISSDCKYCLGLKVHATRLSVGIVGCLEHDDLEKNEDLRPRRRRPRKQRHRKRRPRKQRPRKQRPRKRRPRKQRPRKLRRRRRKRRPGKPILIYTNSQTKSQAIERHHDRNYQRNLTSVFSICQEMPSDSK